MARKPTETVGLTLRIREELRRKLEREADRREVSLNREITRRLENSFQADEHRKLVTAIVGSPLPPYSAAMMRLVVAVLNVEAIRGFWGRDTEERLSLAEAINKVIRVYYRLLDGNESDFPHRDDKESADYLAWQALKSARLQSTRMREPDEGMNVELEAAFNIHREQLAHFAQRLSKLGLSADTVLGVLEDEANKDAYSIRWTVPELFEKIIALSESHEARRTRGEVR